MFTWKYNRHNLSEFNLMHLIVNTFKIPSVLNEFLMEGVYKQCKHSSFTLIPSCLTTNFHTLNVKIASKSFKYKRFIFIPPCVRLQNDRGMFMQ